MQLVVEIRWALRSQGIQHSMLHSLSHDPLLSQRVSYTLLDQAWYGGRAKVIEGYVVGKAKVSHNFYPCCSLIPTVGLESEHKKLPSINLQKISDLAAQKTTLTTLPIFIDTILKHRGLDHQALQNLDSIHGLSAMKLKALKRLNTLEKLAKKNSQRPASSSMLALIWEDAKSF